MDKQRFVEDLISRMSGERDHLKTTNASQTISWKAFRESESLMDEELVPLLFDFLKKEKSPLKRENAYYILMTIGANLKKASIIEEVLGFSTIETSKDLIYKILLSIYTAGVPISKNHSFVTGFVTDENDMLRNAAIRVLGLDISKSQIIEDALLEVLEDPYDDFGIRYAATSLAKIGSGKALPLLRRTLKEIDNGEVASTIKTAIEKITNRMNESPKDK